MRFPRVFPCLLLSLLLTTPCWLPASPAAAQTAPSHEGEGSARHPRNTPRKASSAAPKAARKAPARKAPRGPAAQTGGKQRLRDQGKNHDARVSRENLRAGKKKRSNKADSNHDGVVSSREARRGSKRLTAGKPVKHRRELDKSAKSSLSGLGKNKNGRVAQQENLARREKRFAEMDVNHDGVISPQEARSWRLKAGERREERKAQAKALRLRRIEEAKARKNVAGSLSSTGPELTAPVTPPPAPAATPSAPPAAPRQEDLPLTPIAPAVPAQATPET
ncbi:MAG: hypothetical protein P4L39_05740 [Humidesulfovibrio sp.]|nr:hypothetical protein [Humidesulfovibrio sp.]